MKYSVRWSQKSVQVEYSGDIDNKDIESAHFEMNGDARFYDCRSLILDITNCNMEKVSVPGLILVVATDLGASRTNKSLKVAMIANGPSSIKKASDYISQFQAVDSPWYFKIFDSVNDANEWIE